MFLICSSVLCYRITPPFEANKYCNLILKWSLMKGCLYLWYTNKLMSLDIWDSFSKYVWWIFSFCSALLFISSLLFILHFQSFSQLLSQHLWLFTFGHGVCDCPPWPSSWILVGTGQKWVPMVTFSSSQVPYLSQSTLFLSASIPSVIKSAKLSISQIYFHNCDYSYPHHHHVIIGYS